MLTGIGFKIHKPQKQDWLILVLLHIQAQYSKKKCQKYQKENRHALHIPFKLLLHLLTSYLHITATPVDLFVVAQLIPPYASTQPTQVLKVVLYTANNTH